MRTRFDVIVVGGGATGEVAAGRLADGGLSVALIERELVGGQCSYWACMPSKALLRPGRVLADARRVPGARAAVTGSPDVAAVLAHRDAMAAYWKDDAQVDWLQRHGVHLVRGHGRIEAPRRVRVGSRSLEAERAVVVATGSHAVIPDLDGAGDVDLWDDRAVTSARSVPPSMLVMGGGAVGVEMAQAWRRLGTSSVVVVEVEDRLLPDEEPFAGSELETAFAAESIDVMTGIRVDAVRNGDGGTEVHLSDGTTRTVAAVVAAVGRAPTTEDLGLDAIGLEPGAAVEVDDQHRSIDHPDWLVAAGDVTGRAPLTHMGKYEARIAADVILGRGGDVRPGRTAIARVVFTDPTVVSVGMTEAAARTAGIEVETRRASIGDQAEAGIWGDDVDGTAQVVLDAGERVLVGATFTGPASLAEMAVAAQMAIVGRIPIDTLRHVVPQFPTFSTIWNDLVA